MQSAAKSWTQNDVWHLIMWAREPIKTTARPPWTAVTSELVHSILFVSFHVGVRLHGRSAARKQAMRLLIQNICIDFMGGVASNSERLFDYMQSSTCNAVGSGDTLQFWQQPVAFHLPFLFSPCGAAPTWPAPPSSIHRSALGFPHSGQYQQPPVVNAHTHTRGTKTPKKEGGLLQAHRLKR